MKEVKLLSLIKEDFDMLALSPESKYRLLDRMIQDCDYYLNGNKHPKHLWSGSVEQHIKDMKTLYNSLEEKPEWLSMEDIENYEKRMTECIKESLLKEDFDEYELLSDVKELEDAIIAAQDIAYSLSAKVGDFNNDVSYIISIIIDDLQNIVKSKNGNSYDLNSLRDFIKGKSDEDNFDESLKEDLDEIPVVDRLNFINKRRNGMPGIPNINEFIDCLSATGKDKFMVKETRVGSNLSLGDLKDEWYTLKKYGWKWYIKNVPGEFLTYYVFEKINKSEDMKENLVEDDFDKSLKEAFYDIDETEMFAKEDIMEFADEVASELSKRLDGEVNYLSVYMDGNTLEINLIDSFENEVTVSEVIDRRKAKVVKDLLKYKEKFVSAAIDEFNSFYNDGINESVKDEPHSKEEIRDEIKSVTNNFKNKNGSAKCGFKSECDIALRELKKYYKNVTFERDSEWFNIKYSDLK